MSMTQVLVPPKENVYVPWGSTLRWTFFPGWYGCCLFPKSQVSVFSISFGGGEGDPHLDHKAMPHAIANNSRHIRQEGVSMVFQRNSSGQTEEESLWRPNPETSWRRFRANHICWLHAHLLLVKFTRIKRKASTVSSRFWRKMVCSGCTLATAGYRPWWRCHFWRAPQKTPRTTLQ